MRACVRVCVCVCVCVGWKAANCDLEANKHSAKMTSRAEAEIIENPGNYYRKCEHFHLGQ